MAEKLLVVLMNTDPSNPAELGTPFLQASVAAAMEYEGEIVLTGEAFGRLKYVSSADEETLLQPHDDMMRDAVEAGAKLKICTSSLELWGDELIPEIDETVGAAYIISEAMDDDTVTFTY